MSSPLNAQLLAAQDSARAAALRQSGAAAQRLTPSASSEETALQFKQMLNQLEVAAAAPKPSARPAAAAAPATPPPAPARPTTPDRSAERLAERRSEAQVQDQKLAARRAQNQAGAKAAGSAERQTLSTQALNRSAAGDSGGELDRSSASKRKPSAEERSAESTAAAPQTPSAAEPSTARSDTQAWNGHSREQAQPEDEAEDGDGDALTLEAARSGRLGEAGEAELSAGLTAARPEGSRSPRRDSIAGASDLGSRRASTVDRAQAQVFGKDLNASAPSLASAGAAGSVPMASSEAGSFARMLQSAGGSPEGVSPPAAAISAAQASPGLEALNRSQATDASAPAAGGSGSSAESAQLHLQSPLHAPAFAPELGTRLSLLAAEGVQQAQLHLNPAEMGPVQVQIVLEGQQAQISFHAEQAETRQVLEQSLPDLAAALRDNGLTLSGGGVFQQARDSSPSKGSQGDDERASAGRRSRLDLRVDGAATPGSGAALSTRRSQGVVDLYA